MAKIEDYVNQTDELQDEISTAAENADNRVNELPERFQGKSASEIANSYLELEKMNSRQSQDLGEMRKTVDELVRQSAEPSQGADVPAEDPITVDDLYDDPEAAIKRVMDRNAPPPAEVDIATSPEYLSGVDRLEKEFGEGWNAEVRSPEFQNWVQEAPYRQRMSHAASELDFDAASDLLAQWLDLKGNATSEANRQREQDLGDATLESGGAEYDEPTEKFSRSELLNVRLRAKRGDYEAQNYLKAHQEAIAFAYEDGRIVD